MSRQTRVASVAVVLAVAALPAQDRPQAADFPYSMDFGPCMTTTLLARGVPGVTEKALVVRLPGGAAAFDTELLRMSSIWTDGWLELRGTAYEGDHGPLPRLRGRQLCSTAVGPGVALDGSLADPRAVPHGPLGRQWGRYEGYWLRGDQVVLAYQVGSMEVRELDAIEPVDGEAVAVRHFEFGPSMTDALLVALDAPADAEPQDLALDHKGGLPQERAAMRWQPRVPAPVEFDVAQSDWHRLTIGAPSAHDYLDAGSGTGATLEQVPAHVTGKREAAAGRPEAPPVLDLGALHDGKAATGAGDNAGALDFAGEHGARLHADLQRAVDVSRVSVFSCDAGERATQRYDLFGSANDAAPPLDAGDPAASGWQKLAAVDSRELGQGGLQGTSVSKAGGLGRLRHLLFVLRNGGCRLTEIDVFADRFRAAVDGSERPPVCAAVALHSSMPGVIALRRDHGRILIAVPAHAGAVQCTLFALTGTEAQVRAVGKAAANAAEFVDLAQIVGTPDRPRWGSAIAVDSSRGADDGPFAVDTIAIPFDNPYGSRMRVCGFDFFSDGRAAITTWNGDVWIISGLDAELKAVRWRRFATGLYDPLGLRIVKDQVFVHGRDGITRLVDENGDGEADLYVCFNHDVAVTPAFHEFAFDLQTDPDGNFYCSKGGPVNPGGRGFMKIAPHHGTIMKIAADGSSLEVVATGLRAPNGIGVSPDGKVITSGDNEGTWMPRCRINWITHPGYYGGVRDTAHRADVPDQPDLPLCWMPMEIDNSSGGQVWVTGDKWAPLPGRLLHLSYGTCSVYLVLQEEVDGVMQGGVVRLPCNFSSSAMRARFHPLDGQLYVAGFQGWQTSASRLGGFHRVRYTGKPLHLPVALRTCDRGVYLTFAEPLDAKTATDVGSFGIEIWDYLYSQNYGSPEVSILHPDRHTEQGQQNRDPLPITAASLSPDRRTVFLRVDGMRKCMQMRIAYNVDAADGEQLKGEVHNSIHVIGKDPGFPAAH